ncbi:hypothetical protein NC796_18925 [Aliifodinibius sp. S!AR15-10]|uniref:hypothetical protein n=1 Tax=Aliifodinibius sp. S!AR15-10 TaxID=2950437 RepID=UPI00285E5312|nr:hypothetical protein [Aliifodinibius sp. S!AR15-10]MDR8393236.1 hypothetical protein [Aliifodinibius sp. S!AR15-10]
MNAAHYHLLLNHMPIWATIFAMAILLWGIYSKNNAIKKLAMVGFILAGVSVLAVVQSGEEAEDIVEEIAVISHDDIEAHEDSADISKWLTIMLGIGGVAGLVMLNIGARGTRGLFWSLLLLGLITLASLSYTGYLGGQIRHAEEINASSTGEATDGPDALLQLEE